MKISDGSKIIAMLAVMFLFSGCMLFGAAQPDFSVPATSVSRNVEQDAPPEDVEAAAAELNAFCIDLYGALRGEEGNLFYSPYSIQTALAMTYAGARGGTETEMAAVLRFPLGQDRTHSALNTLDRMLTESDPDAEEGRGWMKYEPPVFRTANSIWGEKDMVFLQPFIDTLNYHYGSGLRLVDFIRRWETARLTVNRWVEDQTERKIQNLMPSGSVTPDTRLILVNAVYFKAAWEAPFESSNTDLGQFLVNGKVPVQVPMMNRVGSYRYRSESGVTAVEMPYAGGRFSFFALMPDDLPAFEERLTPELLAGIIVSLDYGRVELDFPSFTVTHEIDLKPVLENMGMSTSFSAYADFSAMTAEGSLFISDVRHKAFIALDEAGTEAAAATSVGMSLTSIPLEDDPLPLSFDRPFLYFIRDNSAGVPVFAGRMTDPR